MPRDPLDDAVATIPDVIAPRSDDDYLEVIARAVFQTGLSWKQIAQHWGAYRRAFRAFDCAAVAAFGERDVERVLMEPGVLRSPRKVSAVVKNARTILELAARHGSFADYLRSFGNYDSLSKDFKKRFAFMGEMNVWYFLFRVGEPVPEFATWVTTIPGQHPRMAEMVQKAR
jgi:3-methyladenine DNA glycosylase Tag